MTKELNVNEQPVNFYEKPEQLDIQPIEKSYSFFPDKPDSILMVFMSFTLTILFIIAAYFGGKEPWYVNLPVKSQDNIWVLAVLWIIASLISYGAFYLIRNADDSYGASRLLPLFLIISYLNLLWAVIFYLYQSFIATIFLVGLIILINFFIIVFLYYINPWAAVTVIPLFILYIYLFYSFIHLGSVNGITL
jgi:tryptophan-rich sensory protein